MKVMMKCSLVLVFFLIFCGTALAEQNASGQEGEPAGTYQAPRKIRITTALPDGDQSLITERESGSQLNGPANDIALEQVTKAPITSTPLWMYLDNLSLSDKENAIIQLEVPHDLPATLTKLVKEMEELWNVGNFNQAIEHLLSLEESDQIRNIAVGISWKTPHMISGTKWGTDVQIESRLSVNKPCLDFHYDTGNLFAVLKRNDATAWTVNLSTDGGQTWQETYAWYAGAGQSAIDVDAVVVAGYVYVAYVATDFPTEARMRRQFANNGSSDATYGYHVGFDKNVNIREVALASNADSFDNRIYYWAILADNSLVDNWDVATDGTTWTEVATGIGNAGCCLDVNWNAGYTTYYLWASFIDTYDTLHVVRSSAGTVEDIVLGLARTNSHGTSVGAYDDRIMVVYEYSVDDIRYRISYNGGDNWTYGTIATGRQYQNPDVTARKGGGFAVIYEQEAGEPDTCFYRRRDYDIINWTVQRPFNEFDVTTGSPMSLEWIPPSPGNCQGYGAIWLGLSTAYFDRHDWIPGNANGDNQVDVGDVVYLINYLFKSGPAPNPLLLGDANCDGTVDVGDVVYLINFLFKNGPAPCC
jgi:hypothetical protein